MPLVFHHGHGSPYSWRVWLALEFLGVPYELKVLSFSAKDQMKPEFLALNPRHHVPTIVDDGFVLWESLAILEYLDERAGGPPRLYPGTARERARIRRLIREDEEYLDREGLTPVYDEFYRKPEGAAPDEARVAEARRRLAQELDWFAGELGGRPFLAGEAPTAADFVLYPEIAYVKRIGGKKPATQLGGMLPPALAAWAGRIESLPFFDKTFPPHWRS